MGEDRVREARAREHLANERTLLAWVRTAIALMGLGFVVARFGLFLRQLSVESGQPVSAEPSTSISGPIGLLLVGVGILAMVLGTIRYLRARSQIECGRFEAEAFAEVTIAGLTVLGGLGLVGYLLVVR
jgi:putative membrane protein